MGYLQSLERGTCKVLFDMYMIRLMSIGHTTVLPSVEIQTGTAFALLLALAAASRTALDELQPELGDALARIGDSEGESWLNLLGVPLDADAPPTSEHLLRTVDALDPVDLRLHLLGRHAWSWCTLGGIEDIESAARGERAAIRRLLAHPRYYGGHARSSLGKLLRLDPEETRDRIADAIAVGSRHLVAAEAEAELRAAGAAARSLLDEEPVLSAIERIATGYRYVPEPEAERVLLIPHLEPELPLVLAQHRSTRLIAYLATPDRSREDRLLALGRALADPKRVEILAHVGRGTGRATDLVAATGLTRSTVHHHLAQLRETGLVALEGNARAYTYVPRREAAREAAALVAGLIGTEEE
jgi:DNA-binding transcriptional ArsR family regulator